MGHYLGHYNDLAEVIINFLGIGCTGTILESMQFSLKLTSFPGHKTIVQTVQCPDCMSQDQSCSVFVTVGTHEMKIVQNTVYYNMGKPQVTELTTQKERNYLNVESYS